MSYDIELMGARTGRVVKEDNSTINMADLAYGTDVTFHNAATTTGGGTAFAVGGYKFLAIEIYGTSSSRTVQFYGVGPSGTNRALMGIRRSDNTTATSTTGTGEMWLFDITGLDYVVMNLSAVSGGNVSIKGKVVG